MPHVCTYKQFVSTDNHTKFLHFVRVESDTVSQNVHFEVLLFTEFLQVIMLHMVEFTYLHV